MTARYGIDFGTTNSACVGILDKVHVIKYADQYGRPFPSLVIIDPATGEVYGGRLAWMRRQELGETCQVITSVKTYLGTEKTWNIGGKVWTPEMVAAEVLQGLKLQVANAGGSAAVLNEAVVAVPVGFTPAKRAALRRAARMAGIKILSFVSEPTAAFFHHYDEIKCYTHIGVIDWGGGTLDISILENKGGEIRELAAGGIDIGGDDIDLKLAHWVHQKVASEKGINKSFEEMSASDRDMLISRCETAKRDLSDLSLVEIRLNRYGEAGAFSVPLDIDTFARIIAFEVEQAIGCFEETLGRAKLSSDELGCILMLGGSVNLLPFIDEAEKVWNCEKIYPDEPDWSVARGASRLSVTKGQYRLAETVGVIMADGSFYPLLKAGEPVTGQSVNFTFALTEDSKTANFIFADENMRILGYLHVPSFGFFKEKIDLTARINSDLVCKVIARSQCRSKRYTEIWEYSALRFVYQLPVQLEVS